MPIHSAGLHSFSKLMEWSRCYCNLFRLEWSECYCNLFRSCQYWFCQRPGCSKNRQFQTEVFCDDCKNLYSSTSCSVCDKHYILLKPKHESICDSCLCSFCRKNAKFNYLKHFSRYTCCSTCKSGYCENCVYNGNVLSRKKYGVRCIKCSYPGAGCPRRKRVVQVTITKKTKQLYKAYHQNLIISLLEEGDIFLTKSTRANYNFLELYSIICEYVCEFECFSLKNNIYIKQEVADNTYIYIKQSNVITR